MTTEFVASVQSGGANTLRVTIPRQVCRLLHLEKGQLLNVSVTTTEITASPTQESDKT